jgi:PAS domain S-box-containing protein
MAAKHPGGRSSIRGASKKRPTKSGRKVLPSAGRSGREIISAAMQTMKGTPHALRKFLVDGPNHPPRQNGGPAPVFRYPKTELEATIQRYVDLFDFAPIAYVTFDRVGRVDEINLAARRLLDRPHENLIGSPFAVWVAKADAPLFLTHLLRCRSSQGRVETELQLKGREGTTVPVQLSSTPTSSSMKDGALLYQTTVLDLRERKAAEAALRQSEVRFRRYFDLGLIGMAITSPGKTCLEVNDELCRMLGYTRDELMAKTWAELTHPEDLAGDMANFKKTLAGKIDGYAMDKRFVRKDGRIIDSTMSVKCVRRQDRSVDYFVALIQDVTERKRGEEALRISEERNRAIVTQTTVGIVRTDLKGRLIFANQKFCEMLGYAESKLLGKTVSELTHPDDRRENLRLFRRMVAKSLPFELEKRYLRKDGSNLWASVSVSPMRDPAGEAQSALAVVLDISERKKAEAGLRDAKALLESRVRERTAELLAANEELQKAIELRRRLEGEILEVSEREQRRLGQDLHDSLCQHLAATAFMTRALAERVKNAKPIAPEEIENIAALINDGVTAARIIARGLHPVEMDSSGFTVALRILANEAWSIPCRLEVEEDIRIPDATVALHLFRITREAVVNANKHARAREVTVAMKTSPKWIELSITDDGIGIASKQTNHSGMGLHIMNYRASSIGARLEIEPIRPRGTRVSCFLPRK